MRWSRYFLYTEKEEPKEAEAPSHRLLLKAGFIKQVSAGIYELLPPAYKVLKKVESIIRKEMDRSGAQELLLTVLNPKELWEETGRWETYGEELFKLKDRNGREYCLGPTHEEEITDLVRRVVRSYRQLPVILYQIQVKFRDEKRPRFGLIRAREFIMKDAYSFDTDDMSAMISYEAMKFAYQRIFNKLRLNVIMAEADVGQIGGKMSHEFIAFTDYGEAKVAYCENCGYAANAEIVPLPKPEEEKEEEKPMEKVHTPNVHTIEELSKFLDVHPSKIMKAVLYIVNEKEPVLVLIRGDREIDENKLEKVLGTDNFRLATDEEVQELLGTKKGFIGIFNLPENIKVLWDNSLYGVKNLVVALNEPDWHYINVNPGRDFQYGEFVDVAEVREGDPCPKCGSPLKVRRGLELGHIFLLGTRYSEPMKAYFTDRDGKEKPIIMGCYGIGVSRILAALVEQYHDDKGIKWPTPVAPFELDIILLNTKDEEMKNVAEKLYLEAEEKGIDVIFDDREESPGFKFADADLVGFPYRIVVGKKVKEGKVEVQSRHTGEKWDVEIEKAIDFVKEKIEEDKK
ncbi:proline--tRNA ligase [Aquifex aeolicus]|uniref:Proline--tRNA ligase n=1 Tax=Aquifex aeolicus (strain VF5) TaxID=224324 RepID=SYP_AQUAE|nr:proline--tRNA ligase [Aquifex aeolicus]O66690.1 RecName: Full=Proline--tRNA ligase; AltName: Full=Prolyl-tRNA synthetase; Short=ProRS [Aquifex aeolicus VF5]AAC06648.1 proline-tRNA synthetase [Aquifex aeolicus VF5]